MNKNFKQIKNKKMYCQQTHIKRNTKGSYSDDMILLGRKEMQKEIAPEMIHRRANL